MIETIHQHLYTFFGQMKVSITSLQITTENDDTIYNVRIETPDSALIIGIHGQNLQAFNHLLGRMIEMITGKFAIVHLEVNDYMKEKDERFFRYLEWRIDYAMKSKNDVTIPNLNSYERKKAHNHISLKNIDGLKTYSDGEGKERMLHLIYSGTETYRSQPHTSSPQSSSAHTLDDLSEDGIGI